MRRPKDDERQRLEQMRADYYLGDVIEKDLRGKNLDPKRELRIRETMRRVETKLTPQVRMASAH